MVNLLEPLSAEMSESTNQENCAAHSQLLLLSIARVLGFSRPVGGRSSSDYVYFKALERSGALLLGHSQRVKDSASDFSGLDNSLCQLFCSIALCALQLWSVQPGWCLPVLPKMMGILIELLSSTNGYVCSSREDSGLCHGRELFNHLFAFSLRLKAFRNFSGYVPGFTPRRTGRLV
jgi:hypothetical protein